MGIAPPRKKVLGLCGVVLASLSTLFHILGFSTSHWLESYKQAGSRFHKLGLWTACFNNFGYDRDNLGKTYDGCHWIYSYEFRPVFSWLNPSWLLTVQISMTLVLIIEVITVGLCLLTYLEKFIPKHRHTLWQWINSVLMFISGFIIAMAVSLFGIRSDTDRQWLPRPDQNHLAWSFGLEVVAGFFAIFSAMCLLFDSLRMKFEHDKAKKQRDPYFSYKMKPVPPQY